MDRPAKKRRRGGVRQRLAAAEQDLEAEAEARPNERLAEYLKQQWAWGHMSPQTLQAIASHAIGDMTASGVTNFPPLLQKFAALGCMGQHANNMHKELLHLLEKDIHVPKPLMVKLPFAKGDFLQSIILPHALFSHLHHFYPTTFCKQFFPEGVSQLTEFWQTFQMHPCMQGHEMFKKSNFQSAIPIHCHGDAVPVTGKGKVWCKMMLALSWSGALSKGNSQEASNLTYGATRQQSSA